MNPESSEVPVEKLSVPDCKLPDLDDTLSETDQGTRAATESPSLNDESWAPVVTEYQGGPTAAASSAMSGMNFAQMKLERTAEETSLSWRKDC